MVVRKRRSPSALSLSFATLITLAALPLSGPVWGQGTRPQSQPSSQAALPGPSDDLLAKLEGVYKDIHANPELSMQERRTAGIAANWLREQGYEVTEGLGGVGVVGLLRNGEGATVLLRADMDALPMSENTGLPYASTRTGTDPSSGRKTGIAHSCGHDMHVTWLMGATQILAANKDKWRGTVLAVFQPGEETGEGARAMVEDGLTKRFPKPTVALASHVLPFPADKALIRPGLMRPRATACG
jgi:amidohydrolase